MESMIMWAVKIGIGVWLYYGIKKSDMDKEVAMIIFAVYVGLVSVAIGRTLQMENVRSAIAVEDMIYIADGEMVSAKVAWKIIKARVEQSAEEAVSDY